MRRDLRLGVKGESKREVEIAEADKARREEKLSAWAPDRE
jgi:hypothetical protein